VRDFGAQAGATGGSFGGAPIRPPPPRAAAAAEAVGARVTA